MKVTAATMASAIMNSWNRCSAAVQPAIWISMASTKPSTCCTKASASARFRARSGGKALTHPVRASAQRARMPSNRVRVSSLQGTNSGRDGSPVRSNSRLASNWRARSCTASGGSVCSTSTMRSMFMRKRPASLTAAAPPSSFQVTHKVSPMEARATSKHPAPMARSLVERVGRERMAQCRQGVLCGS